jgi:hypothetical protein
MARLNGPCSRSGRWKSGRSSVDSVKPELGTREHFVTRGKVAIFVPF